MTKPRICEVLGVEPGEWFSFSYGPKVHKFRFGEEGGLECADGEAICSGLWNSGYFLSALIDGINHPEHIVRYPRLTEQELAICRALGAKWVSVYLSDANACLWTEKPVFDEGIRCYMHPAPITDDEIDPCVAIVSKRFFPSLKHSDCICVEEDQG